MGSENQQRHAQRAPTYTRHIHGASGFRGKITVPRPATVSLLPLGLFLTLRVLADQQDFVAKRFKSDVTHPGNSLWSNLRGTTPRTIQRHAKMLRELGLIELVERGGRGRRTRGGRKSGMANVWRVTLRGLHVASTGVLDAETSALEPLDYRRKMPRFSASLRVSYQRQADTLREPQSKDARDPPRPSPGRGGNPPPSPPADRRDPAERLPDHPRPRTRLYEAVSEVGAAGLPSIPRATILGAPTRPESPGRKAAREASERWEAAARGEAWAIPSRLREKDGRGAATEGGVP